MLRKIKERKELEAEAAERKAKIEKEASHVATQFLEEVYRDVFGKLEEEAIAEFIL